MYLLHFFLGEPALELGLLQYIFCKECGDFLGFGVHFSGPKFKNFAAIHAAYFQQLDDNCPNDISASSTVLLDASLEEEWDAFCQTQNRPWINVHVHYKYHSCQQKDKNVEHFI